MMWWEKRKELENRIVMLENQRYDVMLENQRYDRPGIVTCVVCGCLVEKYLSTQGKSEVRTKTVREGRYPFYHFKDEEYIYHPYYCKIHAPKEEEKPLDK